jgi:hypothetical protein
VSEPLKYLVGAVQRSERMSRLSVSCMACYAGPLWVLYAEWDRLTKEDYPLLCPDCAEIVAATGRVPDTATRQ